MNKKFVYQVGNNKKVIDILWALHYNKYSSYRMTL